MVCKRCQMVVAYELVKLGVHQPKVKIGEAEFSEDLLPKQLEYLDFALKEAGLELIYDKKNILVEKVKTIIYELVHFSEDQIRVNLSDYLNEKLDYDYTYLANLFSEKTGMTIERFYLTQKIERVKELIIYDELNLSEIAYRMHYSSISHMSNQFKKLTGLTPTRFKLLNINRSAF